MKTKVLWYSDFLCGSGFGRVAHELVARLHATGHYEIHVLGINYHGEPANHPQSPYYHLRNIPVHPASYYPNDPRGERRLLELLAAGDYDLLFAIINPWDLQRIGERIATLRKARGFRFVYYFPIEEKCDPQWVDRAIGVADAPVAYTHFGAEQVERVSGLQCDVIYHGVNAQTFTPWRGGGREQFRSKVWGCDPDTLVMVNVNRNQQRKDLPRSMLVADRVADELDRPVLLYLHCDAHDVAGYDLEAFQRMYLKRTNARFIFGRGQRTLPDEQLARIYGAGDLLISTALCEGWGLSTIEAMAAELPVLVPKSSVFPEIVGRSGERGALAELEGYTMLQGQAGLFSLVSEDNMAEQAAVIGRDVLDGSADLGLVGQKLRAREWVREHCDWDKIALQWDMLLSRFA